MRILMRVDDYLILADEDDGVFGWFVDETQFLRLKIKPYLMIGSAQ